MDFEPGEEQVMIGDSVALFGARHYPASERLKGLTDSADAEQARWREMAELGWLGLDIPDHRGGAGGTMFHVMAVMQGFGRHLMREPFVTRCVLSTALLAAGSTELADRLLRETASGTANLALGVAEARAGFSLHWVETTAEAVAGGFRLTGHKSHAPDGADADWYIIPARSHGLVDDRDGLSLFLVPRAAVGLTIHPFRSIDHHRHATLDLDGVVVDGAALLGPLGQALPLLEAAVERAIAAHLAEAVGSMDALRDVTLEYLKTRHQFGKPIGSFQALQHRMVDMDTACEEARSMVYHAFASLDGDAAHRRRAIMAAKVRVGQCGLYVGRQAVQLHGGLGMSAEHIVSHHLKRQMMLDLAYGNAEFHKKRFADEYAAA